jgi:hypothetical protein
MAGKQFPSLAHARRASSRCLLAVGALLLLSAVYFLLLAPSPPRPVPGPLSNPSAATTSFVASLDRFLDSTPRPAASSLPPADLDATIRTEEEARLYGDPGGAWPAAPAPLRVYVYEMPRKFTYDLLRLFRDSYRQTDNLTSNGSPVHRLIEQVRERASGLGSAPRDLCPSRFDSSRCSSYSTRGFSCPEVQVSVH